MRALGIGAARHIQLHFIRGRYEQLPRVLDRLERAGRIEQVQVNRWPGIWYAHAQDLPLIDRLDAEWTPRTVLLSPFDNLICDRARTRQMFGFDYSIEIYTPASKRRYGYYVLPILHGDRLIGRIDPAMDRTAAPWSCTPCTPRRKARAHTAARSHAPSRSWRDFSAPARSATAAASPRSGSRSWSGRSASGAAPRKIRPPDTS